MEEIIPNDSKVVYREGIKDLVLILDPLYSTQIEYSLHPILYPIYRLYIAYFDLERLDPFSFEPGKSVFIQISSLCYLHNLEMDIKWLIRKRRRTYSGLPVMLRIFQTFNNFNKYHNFQTNGFLQQRCRYLTPLLTPNDIK